MSAKRHNTPKKFFKACGKLLGKIICIFDDLPFLLKGVLPQSLKFVGTYMLAGAGFLAFPVEAIEGIQGFKNAYRAKPGKKGRHFKMATSLIKIGLSLGGIAISAALLSLVILGVMGLGEAVLSVLVPGALAAISGVEFIQKCATYYQIKSAHAKDKSTALIAAERKVGFGATYFGFSLAITALAAVSTLGALSVLSVGIVPVVALISVVTIALAVKVFEMVDKKKNFALTNAIRKFFRGDVSLTELNPNPAEHKNLSQIQKGLGGLPIEETPKKEEKKSIEFIGRSSFRHRFINNSHQAHSDVPMVQERRRKSATF